MHLQLEPAGPVFEMEDADDLPAAAAAASSSVAMEGDRSGDDDDGEGFWHGGSLCANRCVVV